MLKFLDLMLGQAGVQSLSLKRENGLWKCSILAHDEHHYGAGLLPSEAMLNAVDVLRTRKAG